jgi:hypothetical protein
MLGLGRKCGSTCVHCATAAAALIAPTHQPCYPTSLYVLPFSSPCKSIPLPFVFGLLSVL